jgi:hypothetical protein
MALSVCKYMELKTGRSTKSIIKLLKSVTDAKIFDTISQREFVLRSPVCDEILEVQKQLGIIQ